jgi:hypothetical protein
LQSLIKTNPKHAPGWVAAAWLENVAGKSVQARKIIAEGCQHCAKNEDVWIAASELNTNENAKVILANAVQELPQSVRIWMRAVELETEVKAKKRVLRKGELRPGTHWSSRSWQLVLISLGSLVFARHQPLSTSQRQSSCGRRLSSSKTTPKMLESCSLAPSK